MKLRLFILPLFIFFLCPFFIQGNSIPKGKQHTSTIDNLNLDNVPVVLLQYYYYKLSSDDIFEMVMVADTITNNRNLTVLTKHAGDGYLFINNLINEWAINHSPFNYSIDGEIVKTKPMVEKLVSLKKESMDTVYMINADRIIIIKSRECK